MNPNGLPKGDFNMPPGVSVRDIEGGYPIEDDQIVPIDGETMSEEDLQVLRERAGFV